MPISPNQGPTCGGTVVTITGVNLSGTLSVKFGSNNATITANTPTMVTVISPAGSGVVDITVITTAGISNYLQYFYILPPIIVSLSPYSGPTAGGNTVTINGYNLATASSINFGANTTTPTVINDGQITATVPASAGAGSVNVSITTSGGTSSSMSYVYVDTPTITDISPSSGPTNGGSVVTITGTNLASTTSVTIGGSSVMFGVISQTTLSVITPAGTSGAADVVVSTSGGSATAVGGYTYVAGPGI